MDANARRENELKKVIQIDEGRIQTHFDEAFGITSEDIQPVEKSNRNP